MNGLEIIQGIYARLRKPSDAMLPYQTVRQVLLGVVRKKRLDLSLGELNKEAVVSEWFTPPASDFELSSADGSLENVLFPIRVERRAARPPIDNIAVRDVPIVNFQVLSEYPEAVSFYGNPVRMAVNDRGGYLSLPGVEFRIVFEPDAFGQMGTDKAVALPAFFSDMVIEETAFKLLPMVEDGSEDWAVFVKNVTPTLAASITQWNDAWTKYVRNTQSRSSVPKRTFLRNRRCRGRLRTYEGYELP